MNVFHLTNKAGDRLSILERGATMQRWSTRLGNSSRELILSYPDPEAYLQDRFYLGALVGPYANRISKGRLLIGQQFYQLEPNEGQNQLHGGANGLHQMDWQLLEQQHNKLVLGCEMADGQGGYPGPVSFRVTYQLSEQSGVDVELEASSTVTTLVGPTLHPYFNLAPEQPLIDGHKLCLHAVHYTSTDEQNIPTGELPKVQGSPLDFSTAKALNGICMDYNFVVNGDLHQAAAELTSPDGQLRLSVYSDYPGLQVYTGEHLGKPFQARQGICLEPQFFPDSPNQKGFPFHFTMPGQPFKAHIRYQLDKTA
jgi:aldose 1-epimerase